MHSYLAITSNGLETMLADELANIGVQDIQIIRAGVKFKASLEQAYQACLWSRLASRFIRVLSEFNCSDDLDLYLAATAINWQQHFGVSKTFVVDFNGTNKNINNSQYGAMKVKDAIVDKFVKTIDRRPVIDKKQPKVRVHVRLTKEKALIGLDMVGQSLHQRGYRMQAGRAPLRETLAAAIVERSGWRAEQPLLDPMCGSGTLLIEAAMKACDMAPGLIRTQWACHELNDFDHELWLGLKTQAQVKAKRGKLKLETPFYGFDIDAQSISMAKENARRIGLGEVIAFDLGDAAHLERPQGFEKGMIISNPPYGERLSTEPALIALYTLFGTQLKKQFSGCSASIFSSSDELLSCLGMRAERQFKLDNGALPCLQKNYQIAERSLEQLEGLGEVTFVATDFSNRLKKNLAKFNKLAKKEGLDSYRIYDADLPDYNVAIDKYADFLIIQEYAAPKTIPEETAKRRLNDIIRASIAVTGVEANKVILKVREKQKGKSQYQKLANKSEPMTVNEYGALLQVNLFDYLDTGLFLDHRLTRKMLGQLAKGKRFLNLFAYTGSATVHAAIGGALTTTTVDMSNTYLDWAKNNMKLNGFGGKKHEFVQADCLQWIDKCQERFDLIFIDPPTFSNSKRMEESFDVQRDHIKVLAGLKKMLADDGMIVFSNNKRHFKMDVSALAEQGLMAEDISAKTLPFDFARNKHIHNCWLINHFTDK